MAKFFAGQRVRLIKSLTGRVSVGEEGNITEIGEFEADVGIAECRVLFDRVKSRRSHGRFALFFYQIEPILPEGAQPSEFSFTELMDNLGVVVA